MSHQINPSGEWMCCLGCGRETRAKLGYCCQCSPFSQKQQHRTRTIKESKDRPTNPYYHAK